MCVRRRMDKGSGAHCARPAGAAGGSCEVYPKGVIWPNLFFASIRGRWPRMDTDEGVAWLSRGVPPRVRIRTFCFAGLAQGLEAACRAGGRMRYVPDHIVAAG
jgi:hypothetical protein